ARARGEGDEAAAEPLARTGSRHRNPLNATGSPRPGGRIPRGRGPWARSDRAGSLGRLPACSTSPRIVRRVLIEQFFDAGIGHASYLVADPDAGVAFLVDPDRQIDAYLGAASRPGVMITDSFETHVHKIGRASCKERAKAAD